MLNILVIEEDPAIRALVQEWLDAAGYAVDAVHAVHEAGWAHTPVPSTPSLVVASMMNLRGPGAVELQRLQGHFPQVPVVVLCAQLGHSLATGSETAMSLGVSALLAKPFTRAELLRAVEDAVAYGR